MEQRTFSNKSDIVSITLGVIAVKQVTTVKAYLPGISTLQEFIEHQVDELQETLESRMDAGIVKYWMN